MVLWYIDLGSTENGHRGLDWLSENIYVPVSDKSKTKFQKKK